MLLAAGESYADFYRYVDDQGVVHITNVPTSGKYTLMMREKRSHKKGQLVRGGAGAYEDIIYVASMKYGVDPPLVKAIVKAESDFDPQAVSKVGARGLMQLMPETARLMGVANVHDPAENIEGGTRYLSGLLEKFDWQVPMAVAAYNAGETAVHRYGAVPPFEETQEFVKKVLRYYRLYADGAR
jgi:soluble lytic murein transglycosylase